MKKKILPFIVVLALSGSMATTCYAEEIDEMNVAESTEPEASSTENCSEELSTHTEIVETTDSNCTYICNINITCNKETYVMENLCPTGEITNIITTQDFSFEKGTSISEIEDTCGDSYSIIKQAIGNTDVINNSYNIEAQIDIDGKLSITSVITAEPDKETIEVIVYTEEEVLDEEDLDDDEIVDGDNLVDEDNFVNEDNLVNEDVVVDNEKTPAGDDVDECREIIMDESTAVDVAVPANTNESNDNAHSETNSEFPIDTVSDSGLNNT